MPLPAPEALPLPPVAVAVGSPLALLPNEGVGPTEALPLAEGAPLPLPRALAVSV